MNDKPIPVADKAYELDAADPLRSFRDRFHFPQVACGGEAIYFTGNSLGLMPKTAPGLVRVRDIFSG